MTEAEWLASKDFLALIRHIDSVTTTRKWLDSFCAACCRRVWHLLKDDRSRTAIEVMESRPLESMSDQEFEALRDSAAAANREAVLDLSDSLAWAQYSAAQAVHNAVQGLDTRVANDVSRAVAADKASMRDPAGFNAILSGFETDPDEDRWQVACLRCLVGNPFRPATFDPAWRTSTAVALSSQIYDMRDFSPMPILADALQDAGCDRDDILNHCRDAKQVHVRGCWVVDRVLGKE